MTTVTISAPEQVTVPARLLLHLLWSHEALCDLREGDPDDDLRLYEEARDVLQVQAPETFKVMRKVDSFFEAAKE